MAEQTVLIQRISISFEAIQEKLLQLFSFFILVYNDFTLLALIDINVLVMNASCDTNKPFSKYEHCKS